MQTERVTSGFIVIEDSTHSLRHGIVVNVFPCFVEVAVVLPPVRLPITGDLGDCYHLDEVFATVYGLLEKGRESVDSLIDLLLLPLRGLFLCSFHTIVSTLNGAPCNCTLSCII